MAALPPAGWYPDPSGVQRYWDGQQWGPYAPPPAPMQPAGLVVTGPNHAVHAILSLLTFWACGGWIWVWLLVALDNNKQVRAVDAYGRPLPMTAEQVRARQATQRSYMVGGAVFVGLLMLVFIIAALIAPHDDKSCRAVVPTIEPPACRWSLLHHQPIAFANR